MNNIKILSIIPARSGSKGIPDKNIIKLYGMPLIFYSISASKLAGSGRTIVSTDSSDYAKIALDYGAEVPFLRPTKIARDNSSDASFILHTLKWLQENEGYQPDILLHFRPTTPIRDPVVIKEAIREMSNNKWKSLRSAHIAPESPYKWFFKGFDGEALPFNGNNKFKDLNLPRQNFQNVYIPNGYIDILRSDIILHEKAIHTGDVKLFETDPVIEIDTMFDLKVLKSVARNSYKDLIKKLKEG